MPETNYQFVGRNWKLEDFARWRGLLLSSVQLQITRPIQFDYSPENSHWLQTIQGRYLVDLAEKLTLYFSVHIALTRAHKVAHWKFTFVVILERSRTVVTIVPTRLHAAVTWRFTRNDTTRKKLPKTD